MKVCFPQRSAKRTRLFFGKMRWVAVLGIAVVVGTASPLSAHAQTATLTDVLTAVVRNVINPFTISGALGNEALPAATWLGTQQGIPQYDGAYPRPLNCYLGVAPWSERYRNPGLYDCSYTGGSSSNTAVFSIHKNGVANGYSVVFRPSANWVYVPRGSSASGVGSVPTVPAGSAVKLEWSCQPYQNVVTTKCDWGCWNTYEVNNYFYMWSSGPSQYGGSTVGSATVYPTSNTTYNLSCSWPGGHVGGGGIGYFYTGAETITASLPVNVSYTQSCSVPNGSGTQTWNGSSWNACVVSSCNSGYHLINNQCISNSQSCTIENGTGIQTWNGSSWGACTVESCNFGYYISGNECLSSTQSCVIENGTGTQTWGGSAWGECTVESCDPGYQISGNACIPSAATINDFYADPERVRRGTPSMLYWDITNLPMGGCSITSNPAGFNHTANAIAGSIETNDIIQTTEFTLDCGTGSTPSVKTVTIIPTYQEI